MKHVFILVCFLGLVGCEEPAVSQSSQAQRAPATKRALGRKDTDFAGVKPLPLDYERISADYASRHGGL
jgi:hypothetical protein